MEFQTHAAAGEDGEIVATKIPVFLSLTVLCEGWGWVYAAEISQKEVEKDPEMKARLRCLYSRCKQLHWSHTTKQFTSWI